MQGWPKPRQAMEGSLVRMGMVGSASNHGDNINTLANADEMPRDQNPIFLKLENRFESMPDFCCFGSV
jgi:hypothetical protein